MGLHYEFKFLHENLKKIISIVAGPHQIILICTHSQVVVWAFWFVGFFFNLQIMDLVRVSLKPGIKCYTRHEFGGGRIFRISREEQGYVDHIDH